MINGMEQATKHVLYRSLGRYGGGIPYYHDYNFYYYYYYYYYYHHHHQNCAFITALVTCEQPRFCACICGKIVGP